MKFRESGFGFSRISSGVFAGQETAADEREKAGDQNCGIGDPSSVWPAFSFGAGVFELRCRSFLLRHRRPKGRVWSFLLKLRSFTPRARSFLLGSRNFLLRPPGLKLRGRGFWWYFHPISPLGAQKTTTAWWMPGLWGDLGSGFSGHPGWYSCRAHRAWQRLGRSGKRPDRPSCCQSSPA